MNDKAYLMVFAPLGYSRSELDGKTFEEVLDKKAATEVDMLDQMALTHPGTPHHTLMQLHPQLPLMVVVKVATLDEDGEVQYEGVAYHLGDTELTHSLGVRRSIQQSEASAKHVIDGVED